MFRVAASRSARGLVARLASRRMMSAQAQESSVSRAQYIAAAALTGLSAAWIIQDGGFGSNKFSNGEPVAKKSSATATKSSFKNLSVTSIPEGGFIVEYDNDEGTIHFTNHYDKKGAAVSSSEAPIVVPPPPEPVLPKAVVAKLAELEASVAAYQAKVSAFEQAEAARKQEEHLAAEKQAAQEAKESEHAFKLLYFPIRGRAEAVRLLLVDNGVAFEDVRVNNIADTKATLHFGQVPVLYDNGNQVSQSNAILRHLGRVLKLNGSNNDEAARLDYVNEGVEGVRTAYLKVIYQNYDSKDSFVESIPALLLPIEKLVSGDFIVGDKPQYADYSLYETLDTLVTLSPTALDQSPHLQAFHKRMAARPNIAAYLASDKRPQAINGNGKQ